MARGVTTRGCALKFDVTFLLHLCLFELRACLLEDNTPEFVLERGKF